MFSFPEGSLADTRKEKEMIRISLSMGELAHLYATARRLEGSSSLYPYQPELVSLCEKIAAVLRKSGCRRVQLSDGGELPHQWIVPDDISGLTALLHFSRGEVEALVHLIGAWQVNHTHVYADVREKLALSLEDHSET